MGLFDIFKKKEIVTPMPVEHNASFSGYETSSFEMVIEDVFTISGRGTVVTGKISKGSISVGANVSISNGMGSTVTGIEAFRCSKDYAQEGENVGLLLSGVDRNQVKPGDVIYK